MEDSKNLEKWPPKNIKWYYSDKYTAIAHGDCLELLSEMPRVDLVLTDPPYGMNYNTDSTRFKSPRGGCNANWGGIHGDQKSFNPKPFLDYSGVIIFGCNHFGQKLPIGTTLVWIKRLDGNFGNFLSDAELAWMKGGHGVYCKRGPFPQSIARDRLHPSQKPVELMSWCIEKSKIDGLILDPFMGSGTTLVAAKQLNRKAIGIEIEERYCEIAAQRLSQEVLDFIN